jgi:hypothetical protein
MAQGFAIRLNVLGEEQINRRFMRVIARATSFAEPFEVVHDYLTRVSDKQFESEGSYSHHPWEALRQSTIDRKARDQNPAVRANAERVLHATERLRNSLTQQGNPDMVHKITPRMMVYGTKVPYGEVHMKQGSNRARRRPVDLTPLNKEVIVKTLQLYLMRGISRLAGPRP